MKKFTCFIIFCALLGLRGAQAALVADDESGFKLTIELRDGSRLVGKSLDESLRFHSTLLGDLKLSPASIRAIEFIDTNGTAQLTATNGDTLAVQLITSALSVATSFGRTELPVTLIRNIRVSAMTKHGQLPAGLVALWSGEGNGDDSAGKNNATLTGITFSEGKVGQAFVLNGFSSCLKIPASESFNAEEADGLTITAWIKPSDVQGFHPILEWNPSDTMAGIIGVQLWIGARPNDYGVLNGNFPDVEGHPHALISTPGTVVNGAFQHVAMTYDKASGLGVLYLNGSVVSRGQWGKFIPLTKGDLWISRRPTDHPGDWTYDKYFAGLMDEVAIYNRALSAEEIQALCTGQNGGVPPPPPSPTPAPNWGNFRYGIPPHSPFVEQQ